MLKRPMFAFNSSRTLMARARGSFEIAIWSLESDGEKPLLSLSAPGFGLASLVFREDDELVALTRDGTVVCWTLASGENGEMVATERWRHAYRTEITVARSFLRKSDTPMFAAGDTRGFVLLIDVSSADGPRTTVGHGHTDAIVDITVDRGGMRLASSGRDLAVCIWPLEGKKLYPVEGSHEISAQDVLDFFALDDPPQVDEVEVSEVTTDDVLNFFSTVYDESTLEPEVADDEDDEEVGDQVEDESSAEESKVENDSDFTEAAGEQALDEALAQQGPGQAEVSIAIQSQRAPSLPGADLIAPDVLSVERRLSGLGGWVLCLEFSNSGEQLVAGGIDNGVYLWDLTDESAEPQGVQYAHYGWVVDVAWSPDDTVIASASWDTTIGLFDAKLNPTLCFEGHTDYVSSLVFTGDDLLVSASFDATINLWKWRDPELVKTRREHSDWVEAVEVLDAGLVSLSSDDTTCFWSSTGELERQLGRSFGAGIDVGQAVDLSEYVDTTQLASYRTEGSGVAKREAVRYADKRSTGFGSSSGRTAMTLLEGALDESVKTAEVELPEPVVEPEGLSAFPMGVSEAGIVSRDTVDSAQAEVEPPEDVDPALRSDPPEPEVSETVSESKNVGMKSAPSEPESEQDTQRNVSEATTTATQAKSGLRNIPAPSSVSSTPEPKAPEAKSPEAKSPEAKAPEAKSPEAKAPEAKAPEAKAPEARAPESKVLEAKAPEPEVPESKAPEVKAPEPEVPEAKAPEVKAPEPEVPEAKAPEVKAPEPEVPEAKAPEVKAPEPEVPEAKAPEVKAPEPEVPEAKAPEPRSPESKSPGSKSPEAKAPEELEEPGVKIFEPAISKPGNTLRGFGEVQSVGSEGLGAEDSFVRDGPIPDDVLDAMIDSEGGIDEISKPRDESNQGSGSVADKDGRDSQSESDKANDQSVDKEDRSSGRLARPASILDEESQTNLPVDFDEDSGTHSMPFREVVFDDEREAEDSFGREETAAFMSDAAGLQQDVDTAELDRRYVSSNPEHADAPSLDPFDRPRTDRSKPVIDGAPSEAKETDTEPAEVPSKDAHQRRDHTPSSTFMGTGADLSESTRPREHDVDAPVESTGMSTSAIEDMERLAYELRAPLDSPGKGSKRPEKTGDRLESRSKPGHDVLDVDATDFWQGRPKAQASAPQSGIVRRRKKGEVARFERDFEIRTPHAHVYGTAVSHDAKWVASCGADDSICVWSRRGDQAHRFRVDTEGVNCLAFSPDGDLLGAGCDDGIVHVWLLRANGLRHTRLVGHGSWISSLTFSADSRYLVSSSFDGTARVWNLERGECLGTLEGHEGPVSSVAVSATRSLTAGHDGTVRVWNPGWIQVDHFDGYDKLLDVTTIGVISAWCGADGEVFMLDSDHPVALLRHRGEARSVCLREDGTLMSLGEDGQLMVYHRGRREPHQGIRIDSPGWCVSTAATTVACGGDDGKIYLLSQTSA